MTHYVRVVSLLFEVVLQYHSDQVVDFAEKLYEAYRKDMEHNVPFMTWYKRQSASKTEF